MDLHITSMINGESVNFKAYITDMTQTFSSTWNTEDVFGRNDPIAMFQGTKRTISLALDVPAADKEEAATNLSKCGELATFLYPGYEPWKGGFDSDNPLATGTAGQYDVSANTKTNMGSYISRPPLIKIKFLNLIDSMRNAAPKDIGGGFGEEAAIITAGEGLLGYVDSYTFTPVMDAGMFIGGSSLLYPRTITISLTFNVLHQTDLGHGGDGKGKTAWLAKKLPFS